MLVYMLGFMMQVYAYKCFISIYIDMSYGFMQLYILHVNHNFHHVHVLLIKILCYFMFL